MYIIFAVFQGDREIESYRVLPHPEKVGPKVRIAYYFYVIRNGENTVLVDTGMDDHEARIRGIRGTDYIAAQLRKLDLEPEEIRDVVVTHLHSDHFSAYYLYPKATFHIQSKEIEFLTGPATRFSQIMGPVPDMAEVMKLAAAKRIRYLDGDESIVPGIRVVLVGGHSPGSQLVVVKTGRGDAVICGDAADFYRNLEDEGVGAIHVDLLRSLMALDRIKSLASSPELIIPSHDPLVMEKFPKPIEGIAEIC